MDEKKGEIKVENPGRRVIMEIYDKGVGLKEIQKAFGHLSYITCFAGEGWHSSVKQSFILLRRE